MADHFISKVEAGKRARYRRERERARERVRVWVDDAQSVSWKSRCLGKHVFTKKGKNASIKINEKSEKDR
jgi:hypothetical protein